MEIWVRFQSWDDSLEEGMATHSSIVAWRILWTEEPGGFMGRKKSDSTEATEHSTAQYLEKAFWKALENAYELNSKRTSEGIPKRKRCERKDDTKARV